jgi:hypothetical protein
MHAQDYLTLRLVRLKSSEEWSLNREGLVGNDPADSTARVGDVAFPTWADVHMRVWHRLTAGSTVIDTDVESIRPELFGKQFADSRDLRPKRGKFLGGSSKIEPTCRLGITSVWPSLIG